MALMERTLKQKRVALQKFVQLGSDLDTHWYKEIAEVLRLLLLHDKVLFNYCDGRAKTLHAYFPALPGPGEQDWDLERVSWDPLSDPTPVTGRAIMKQRIMTIPFADRSGKPLPNGRMITVTELINEVANKDGAAHLNLDLVRRRLLDAIAAEFMSGVEGKEPADSLGAKIAMLSLAEWAIKAIDFALAP